MKDFEQDNIIDKWLEKNGTKEIEKQVENEYKEIMKLEDRFKKIIEDANYEKLNNAPKQCVEISNAETIGFAYWVTDPRNENVKGNITIEELFKIYQDL